MSQIKATIFSEFANLEPPYKIPEYMKPLLKVRSKKEWDDCVHRCLYGRGRISGCYCLTEKAFKGGQEIQQEQCKGKTIKELLDKK